MPGHLQEKHRCLKRAIAFGGNGGAGIFVACRPEATTGAHTEQILLMIRVVRNSVPAGADAVQQIVASGILQSLANAFVSLSLGAMPSVSAPSAAWLAAKQLPPQHATAYTQLLANLSASGEVGCQAVLNQAWPAALLVLLQQVPGVI